MSETPEADASTRAYDIMWNVLMAGAALFVGFLAWDYFSDGEATRIVGRVFSQVRPSLAAVVPIREGADGATDADAG